MPRKIFSRGFYQNALTEGEKDDIINTKAGEIWLSYNRICFGAKLQQCNDAKLQGLIESASCRIFRFGRRICRRLIFFRAWAEKVQTEAAGKR